MAAIAIYSPKGGVGKTTLSVNLAWAAATLSSRRTLLWDLDAQASASFILAPDRKAADPARAVLERDVAPERLIVPTNVARLDLLPADTSLRALDHLFGGMEQKKRLRRLTTALQQRYDRILIDCPPGIGPTTEQIIRGVSLIVVPVIPSTLALRTARELTAHLHGRKTMPAVMPVFNLADRRRAGHRAALAEAPEQPVIPMTSLLDQIADRHAPLGAYAPRSPAAAAIADLWRRIEATLARLPPDQRS
ncbi:ParA family protein [uncultured Sphingomonas sp.]|uniref:ParA family protein n=1 Tax=uncultured Sphingomonas sp. TaxID=158754 RepID=UPI0025E97D7A|nr:ParA family protein [uncultured Sphingomonas sp.]